MSWSTLPVRFRTPLLGISISLYWLYLVFRPVRSELYRASLPSIQTVCGDRNSGVLRAVRHAARNRLFGAVGDREAARRGVRRAAELRLPSRRLLGLRAERTRQRRLQRPRTRAGRVCKALERVARIRQRQRSCSRGSPHDFRSPMGIHLKTKLENILVEIYCLHKNVLSILVYILVSNTVYWVDERGEALRMQCGAELPALLIAGRLSVHRPARPIFGHRLRFRSVR